MSSMIVFGTPLVAVNYVGIALVVVGFVILNLLKMFELKVDTTPVISYDNQPAVTMDLFASKDRSFSQPRDE
jgi:hypothetical protein